MALDHEKLKRTKEGARGGRGWKPKPGPNRVFVLPLHSKYLDEAAQEELDNLALQYKIHYFRVEGRPTEVSRCLEETKERCPACETWRKWRKSEDPALKDMARDISPSDVYLFNILDLNNLQTGVQQWPANYTCWNGIMDIAINPMWGNVINPADGIVFNVNMTPANQSRTGYNNYQVQPEPQRVTVMETLSAFTEWRGTLDRLEEQKAASKTADEIRGLLEEMGFPQTSYLATNTEAGARPPAAPAAPTASRAPAPPAAPTTAPVPSPVAPSATPAPPAAPAAPTAPAPAAVPAAPAPVAQPTTTAPTPAPVAASPVDGATGTPHYDPGPDYEPVLPEDQHPAGAPRCFKDYRPDVHQCRTCAVVGPCQEAFMGIDDDE